MSKHQNSSVSYFHVLDYFVKWWYFLFGKSFLITSHCSMFIIMSTIIFQSFTFFGIYLIFLNSVSKSDIQPSKPVFYVSVYGRPDQSTDHLFISYHATESWSVDRADRPKAPSVDRTGRPTIVQNCFFVFLLSVGRPTKFPVDRQ